MIIETKLKEKYPGISTVAVELIVANALRAEVHRCACRAINQIHIGNEVLDNEACIEAIAEEAGSFDHEAQIFDGVLYGILASFKASGHIPKDIVLHELMEWVQDQVEDFLDTSASGIVL